MFHLLRHKALSNMVKPLVVLMSKRLLRYKDAMSDVNDFTNGGFKPLIADDKVNKKKAERIIVCSGQVYYDLLNERKVRNLEEQVAVIRVERLYPFPVEELHLELSKFEKAREFIWAQEEPYNQGAWLQVRDALDAALKDRLHKFTAASRPSAAAPACGTTTMHNEQLKQLLNNAFA